MAESDEFISVSRKKIETLRDITKAMTNIGLTLTYYAQSMELLFGEFPSIEEREKTVKIHKRLEETLKRANKNREGAKNERKIT